MTDDGELHQLVGEAMIKFMTKHISVFPNALLSKADFWLVPTYKRAMVFTFMTRFVYGKDGQKQWKLFSFQDYKLNVRLMKKWIATEREVMEKCDSYKALPDTADRVKRKQRGRGRRNRSKNTDDTSTLTESPQKRQCVVNDDFSDDSDVIVLGSRRGEGEALRDSEED